MATPVYTQDKILTPEEFNRCISLIKSNDPADWAILQQVMLSLNREACIIEIWTLARINWYRMVNLRTKAGREFASSLALSSLGNHAGGQQILKYLQTRGWLTPERFLLFKDKTLNDLSSQTNHQFYEVRIELRPEYKHLDPTDTLIYNPYDKSIKRTTATSTKLTS